MPGGLPVDFQADVAGVPVLLSMELADSKSPKSTRLPPPWVSVTLSMNVVLSTASVPVKVSVCVPLVATENGRLKVLKLVLAGDTRLPIWVPSIVTLVGCGTPQRDEAWNESV